MNDTFSTFFPGLDKHTGEQGGAIAPHCPFDSHSLALGIDSTIGCSS
jgi:hypothetical protein